MYYVFVNSSTNLDIVDLSVEMNAWKLVEKQPREVEANKQKVVIMS